MDLILLILLGAVPMAYVLNHALSDGTAQSPEFVQAMNQGAQLFDQHGR